MAVVSGSLLHSANVHRESPWRRNLVGRVLSLASRENPRNEVRVSMPIGKSPLTGYLRLAQALCYPTTTRTILLASGLIQKRYCS